VTAAIVARERQRHHRERQGEQASVRPSEAAEHSPCATPEWVVASRVIPRAEGRQQAERFAIRRAEEDGEWVGGQKGDGRETFVLPHILTRETIQVQEGSESRGK